MKPEKRSGEMLTEARKKLGLTIEQLAEAVLRTTPHIWKWEHARVFPSQQVAERVARVLSLNGRDLWRAVIEEKADKARARAETERQLNLQLSYLTSNPGDVPVPKEGYHREPKLVVVREEHEDLHQDIKAEIKALRKRLAELEKKLEESEEDDHNT